MNAASPFGLFEAFGIELEYMIVDLASLAPLPWSDVVLRDASGAAASDVEDGAITWSNELAAHVIELKTTEPTSSLSGLGGLFHESALKIDGRLRERGAGLLPTAMHPFLNPATDVKLWAHEHSEVYSLYDRIFGCKGHGWSNLQSMHVNLPFRGDDEFGRLHAAIRFALPLLPALAASSPIEEGRLAPQTDRRLFHYRRNQAKVPSIAGDVVPEPVFSPEDYERSILQPMYRDVAPFDPAETLREDWLNSRGAIPRFGRSSIEIRVLDCQECPSNDLAVAKFVCNLTWALANEELASQASIREFSTPELAAIYEAAIQHGTRGIVASSPYAAALGCPPSSSVRFVDLMGRLLEADAMLSGPSPLTDDDRRRLSTIIERGNLSERIRTRLPAAPSENEIRSIYLEIRERFLADEPFK